MQDKLFLPYTRYSNNSNNDVENFFKSVVYHV